MNAAAAPQPFPWDDVLEAGLGRLRLPPDAFWAMTPRELASAIGAHRAARRGPGKAELAALMQAFPDD